jgi:hypothetical protein
MYQLIMNIYYLLYIFFFKQQLNPLNLSRQYTWPKEKQNEYSN